MVLILQQSTDNGKRFVSTVVADEETSFNSNFSLNSENSISERSAIYKQRIDSLFGRPTGQTKTTKGPSGKTYDAADHQHMGEKVNGTQGDNPTKKASSTASSSTTDSSPSSSPSSSSSPLLLQFQQTSHHSSLSTSSLHSTAVSTAAAASSSGTSAIAERKVLFSQETQSTILFSEEDDIETEQQQQVRNKRFTKRRDRHYIEGKILEAEEEDEIIVPQQLARLEHNYERVIDKSCPSSVITDSLNQSSSPDFSKYLDEDLEIEEEGDKNFLNQLRACKQSVFKGFSQHVSFINVPSDQKNTPHPKAGANISNPKLSALKVQTYGEMSESHMWRNGSYGDSPTSSSNNEERNFGIVRSSPGGILKFPVEYLGSIPVEGNTTALQDLQAPLRTLYCNFLTGTNVLDGDLAITSDGLRFEAPKVRLVNPFTTIAVWAAIKFVTRDGTDCAFMPLISDPEGQDKGRLYGKMNPELIRAYRNCVNGSSGFRNPPIFACVMREATFTLDCHAFVCKCAEDAIVIAANLYQSLVDKMRSSSCSSSSSSASGSSNPSPTKIHIHNHISSNNNNINKSRKGGESGYGSLSRNSPPNQLSPTENRSSSSASSQASPANNNCELVCSALRPNHGTFHAQSSTSSGSATSSADETRVRCNNICPPGPSHIRHHNKPSSSKMKAASQERDLRVVFSDSESIAPIRPPRKKKKSSGEFGHNLKRYGSDDSVLLKIPPRRRSFKASKNGIKKRVQISTPDDLTSSEQSINESIDQVLDRIVHPGGMSFNDLKPGYQQLLLKIALTLTQDQLYQKSKQAMKKHQQSRKKPGLQKTLSDSSDDSQFLNLLMKSFAKITSGKTPQTKESRGSKSGPKPKGQYHQKGQLRKKPARVEDPDPFMSFCSGCACDKCSEKCYCSLPSKQKSVGFHPPDVGCKGKEGGGGACSQGPQQCGGTGKKPCGYDTDSCAESEKCYCSLQRVKSNGLKIYNINLDTETSDTDTNSYDFEPFNRDDASKHTSCSNLNTVSAHSVEILSYNPQSTTQSRFGEPKIHTTNAMVHFESTQDQDNEDDSISIASPPTKYAILKPNISFLHSKPMLPEMIGESSNQQMQRNKVLLITGSTPSTRVMYQPPLQTPRQRTFLHGLDDVMEAEDGISHKDGRKRSKNGSADFGTERIISMKKTAEIAAMFSELKIEPRNLMPDLRHDPSESSPSTSEESNLSLDLEASLGYLP